MHQAGLSVSKRAEYVAIQLIREGTWLDATTRDAHGP